MSDNRRVYRTIRTTMRQLFPTEPKGNQVRMLATLAAMVSGIVLGKSCQLPTIARKTPDQAKADSRIKRYSRWTQNERIDYEGYYLPFVSQLLNHLASIRELVFIIDGSEVGHGCLTLMISLIYGHRTLPITWLVVSGSKGHLSERLHLDLLSQLQAILPQDCQAIFLGDGEFDGIELQAALQSLDLRYVCRTAKNTQLYEDGILFSFADLCLRPGDQISIPNVCFTLAGYGPVTVIAWWKRGYHEPIFLVTNFELCGEACHGYQKRFQIETFFSDQKSRGFYLHKSHLSDPERLSSLMIAACLAYLWIVYLGLVALRQNWVSVIRPYDRCDWSLFRLGLALLDHLLNASLPIPASLNLRCGKHPCRCPKPKSLLPQQQTAAILRDRKGRGGKTVTVIRDLQLFGKKAKTRWLEIYTRGGDSRRPGSADPCLSLETAHRSRQESRIQYRPGLSRFL